MKRNDPFAKIDPFLGIRPMHTQKQQRPYAHSNVIPSSMTTERDPKIVETSHKLGVGSIPFAAWRVPRIDYVNTHTQSETDPASGSLKVIPTQYRIGYPKRVPEQSSLVLDPDGRLIIRISFFERSERPLAAAT